MSGYLVRLDLWDSQNTIAGGRGVPLQVGTEVDNEEENKKDLEGAWASQHPCGKAPSSTVYRQALPRGREEKTLGRVGARSSPNAAAVHVSDSPMLSDWGRVAARSCSEGKNPHDSAFPTPPSSVVCSSRPRTSGTASERAAARVSTISTTRFPVSGLPDPAHPQQSLGLRVGHAG